MNQQDLSNSFLVLLGFRIIEVDGVPMGRRLRCHPIGNYSCIKPMIYTLLLRKP